MARLKSAALTKDCFSLFYAQNVGTRPLAISMLYIFLVPLRSPSASIINRAGLLIVVKGFILCDA